MLVDGGMRREQKESADVRGTGDKTRQVYEINLEESGDEKRFNETQVGGKLLQKDSFQVKLEFLRSTLPHRTTTSSCFHLSRCHSHAAKLFFCPQKLVEKYEIKRDENSARRRHRIIVHFLSWRHVGFNFKSAIHSLTANLSHSSSGYFATLGGAYGK